MLRVLGPALVGILMMFLGFWLLTSDINFELNTTLRTILVITFITISVGFFAESFGGTRDRIRKR